MEYFVYILQSQKDNGFYIGQTNNLKDRLDRHNKGQVHATKFRLPMVLIYQEFFQTRTEAMQREKYLKSLKSPDYIRKNIIEN